MSKRKTWDPLPGFPRRGILSTLEQFEQFCRKGRIVCLLCGRLYRALGIHVFRAHSISSDDYRSLYGIPKTASLCDEKTQARKAASVMALPGRGAAHLLPLGICTQFRKGERPAMTSAPAIIGAKRARALEHHRGLTADEIATVFSDEAKIECKCRDCSNLVRVLPVHAGRALCERCRQQKRRDKLRRLYLRRVGRAALLSAQDRAYAAAAGQLETAPGEYAANRAKGLKWCSGDKHWASLSAFYAARGKMDGLNGVCGKCQYGAAKIRKLIRKEAA